MSNTNDLCIAELTFAKFFHFFSYTSDALARYNLKKVFFDNLAFAFAAFLGDIGVGYIIVSKNPVDSSEYTLSYIKTEEEFRGRGIAKALINHAANFLRTKNIALFKASTIQDNPYFNGIDPLLLGTGFDLVETSTIFRCKINEINCQKFTNMKQSKTNKIINRLISHGFEVVDFKSAGEIFDRLICLLDTEFEGYLDPSIYHARSSDRIVLENSFIAHKNGIPVSFCTVTTTDSKNLVFQQLSVSRRYQRTGIFLMPLVYCLDKSVADGKFAQVAYTVYDVNDKMQQLAQGFLAPLSDPPKTQKMYKLEL